MNLGSSQQVLVPKTFSVLDSEVFGQIESISPIRSMCMPLIFHLNIQNLFQLLLMVFDSTTFTPQHIA